MLAFGCEVLSPDETENPQPKTPPPKPKTQHRELRPPTHVPDLTILYPKHLDFEQVSLEATHHGPWVSAPSLFAEIGSCEAQWGRDDAADLWADILADELNLEVIRV